ncbi:hypothetical protein [Heyndrickxia ginsengihumi]|uniref:hypothetical protein n=1 Tax=Heyndrickxia ginsengihumi TaxID=363870 RepID=UPI00203ACA21|nr:hypothetical protein [Heyndrickxia ginsengihumi]MCM3025118.1 hypothetical protein [Heyndrickxia ginsengihumi]
MNTIQKYSTEQLIDLNELFYGALSVTYHKLYHGTYLEILMDNGTYASFYLSHRDFNLIKGNFFIEDIHKAIDRMLDGFPYSLEFNPNNSKFPVKIFFKNSKEYIIDTMECNTDELEFILRAYNNQKDCK